MNWRKSSYSGAQNCVEVGWNTASLCGDRECVEVGWGKSSHSMSNGDCVEVGTALEKSSHSNLNGNCVEVGPCACGGDVLVRDTKDRDGGTLSFSPQVWREFTEAIKAGEYG